jgi:hypothetical protein
MRGMQALLVGVLALVASVGPLPIVDCGPDGVAEAGLRPRTWRRRPLRRVLSAPARVIRGCRGGSCSASADFQSPACACVATTGHCECAGGATVGGFHPPGYPVVAGVQPEYPDAETPPPADYSIGGGARHLQPALPQELPAAAGAGRLEPALP